MAYVTSIQKKSRTSSGWGGWSGLSGVDYVNNNGLYVVYGVGLSMSAGEQLTSLSISTNFVAPQSSNNPSTATCYLYTSDPTGYASPPGGMVASASASFNASASGSYVTFNLSGFSIPTTSVVYVWFTCSTTYTSYGSNQIYHYSTGNGYTYAPAAYIGTTGGSSTPGGGNTGGSSSSGNYTVTVKSGAEGIAEITIETGYPSTYKLVKAIVSYGYEFVGWYEYNASAAGGYGALLDSSPLLSVVLNRNYVVIPRTRKFGEDELRKITFVPHSFLDLSTLKFYYRGNYDFDRYDLPYPPYDEWNTLTAPYEIFVYDKTNVSFYFESTNGQQIECVYYLCDGVVTEEQNGWDYDDFGRVKYRDECETFYQVETGINGSGDVYAAPNIYVSISDSLKRTITPQAGANITSVTGGQSYLNDREVAILRATPAAGYAFEGWYVNGQLVSTKNPYFIEATSTMTVVAQAAPERIISVEGDAGISSVTGGGTFVDGNTCTLYAEAAYGYTFDGWNMGSTRVSTSNPYSFSVSSNSVGTYRATSTPKSFKISVRNPVEGTLDSYYANYNSQFTATTTVRAGYEFGGWKVNGTIVSTQLSYTFTVTGEIELIAVINPIVYTITPIAGEGIASVSGGGSYPNGASCTLTATLKECYSFSAWLYNNIWKSGSATYTFTVNYADFGDTRNISIEARAKQTHVVGTPYVWMNGAWRKCNLRVWINGAWKLLKAVIKKG